MLGQRTRLFYSFLKLWVILYYPHEAEDDTWSSWNGRVTLILDIHIQQICSTQFTSNANDKHSVSFM